MSPSARPPPIRRTPTEQAHNTRKGHAASVRRQSRQRLRCVRPYKRYTEAFRLTRDGAPRSSRPTEIYIATPPPPTGTAAFTAQRTTIQPSSPGGKSSEAGRAAAAAHSKSKDGGTLSRHLLLSKNHRRRVRSTEPNLRAGLPKLRRVLWFLGGRA